MSDSVRARDLIDYSLTDRIMTLVRDNVNDQQYPLGVGLATLSLALVASIRNGMDLEAQPEALADVLELMTELYNEGWQAPGGGLQ